MKLLASNYDVIFLAIILFSAVLALIKGGVAEVLSLSVWFLAFAVMQHYGSLIDSYIPHNITNQFIRSAIIFIIAFIALAIIMTIVKKLCAGIINSVGLGGLNRLLGIIFGIIRGILICAILVIVISMFDFDPTNAYQESRLYPVIHPVVEWIVQALPKKIETLPKPPIILPSY